MDDLISREWVLKNMMFDVDREVVRKAPAVDVKPVQRYQLKLICPTNGASCNECIPGAPCAIKKKEYNGSVDCNDIARFPRVDAVPVVRCKECMHYRNGICEQIEDIMDGYYHGTFEEKRPDDFCSYGVKMERCAE